MLKFHQICRQAYYQRICQQMKHRESIFKENIDIKRVLQKGSVPFTKSVKDKYLNNKKKITLFLVFCGVLNIHPVYTIYLQYFPNMPIQRRLRELLLGPQDFESILELSFKNKLIYELLKEFIDIDREFHFGFTRRLIIKALKAMEVRPSKQIKAEFYKSSGYVDKVYNIINILKITSKLSSVNLKELQTILYSTYLSCGNKFQNFDQFQQKFLEALRDVESLESNFQQTKKSKLIHKLPSLKSSEQDLVTTKLPLRLKYEILKQKSINQPEWSDKLAAMKQQLNFWSLEGRK